MKKIHKYVKLLVVAFVVVNILWFGWSRLKYGKLSEGMKHNEFSNPLVPRKYCTDEDGFVFSIKYPDYLSLTGNMAIGLPSDEDNFFTDGLIIWPNIGGKYEYGALLYEKDGNRYQENRVYIDKEGKPLKPEDQELVTKHRRNIEILLQKAAERWNIPD